MIVSEIRDLEQYIKANVKANCHFGLKDNDPNLYPLIEIRVTEDFDIYVENERMLTTDIPLELRIIVARENELKALEVLERLYLKINQFNTHRGHILEGSGTPEYVEETKTYEISLLYKLKLIIQDT
nr:hypothetical protein 14 [Legionellales bacterium]